MKTRLAIFAIISALALSFRSSGQILYTESSAEAGIEHFYGTGAPGGGVSFHDFNQDGLDDITLGGSLGEGIQFYENTGSGFNLLSPLADIPYEVKQILWVDFDNDEDKDLYVACFDGHNLLFENQGGLILQDITTLSGLPTEVHRGFGALWADFNRDSWLDLYYVKRRTEDESVLNENRLFLNHPNGSFVEVTDFAGVADRGKKPFCAVAIDYDNDKWPDIYINNDKQTINTLLHNNGDGTFEDVSVSSKANIQMDAMGTALGDYDNDGLLDMYVSNIPTGNVLLHNDGPDQDGIYTFTDLATESNTIFHSVAWGTNFLDADNDCDLDLYVSGMLSGESQINSTLYENLGDGTFRNLEGELVGDTCISFSNAIGDFNQDGVADIMVVNQGDFHSQLWRSYVPLIPNHYLKIKLKGIVSNKDAIGTRIETFAGDLYQMRYTHCGIGFLGQNSGTEILGLKDHTKLDSLRITWPTGHVDLLKDLSVDGTVLITEGSSTNGEIHVDPDITIISSTTPPFKSKHFSALSISPNPASEFIFIEGHYKGQYKITNLDGHSISNGELHGKNEISINLLPQGWYQITLIAEGKAFSGSWFKI